MCHSERSGSEVEESVFFPRWGSGSFDSPSPSRRVAQDDIHEDAKARPKWGGLGLFFLQRDGGNNGLAVAVQQDGQTAA